MSTDGNANALAHRVLFVGDMQFDSIPQARVVRKGGQLFPTLPVPRTDEPSALREQLFATLNMLVGLWPLTAIVLFAAGLLIMAGNNGAP